MLPQKLTPIVRIYEIYLLKRSLQLVSFIAELRGYPTQVTTSK